MWLVFSVCIYPRKKFNVFKVKRVQLNFLIKYMRTQLLGKKFGNCAIKNSKTQQYLKLNVYSKYFYIILIIFLVALMHLFFLIIKILKLCVGDWGRLLMSLGD